MTKGREILLKVKGDKCWYCGASVQDSLRAFGTAADFEFDHVDPDRKAPEYKNLMKRVLSAMHFQEIEKCILLCVKCHRILHSQNRNGTLTLTTTFEGMEPIVQVLKCQEIWNNDTQESVMFPSPDEWQLANLFFQMEIGSQPRTIMSGLQLRPVLNSLIERTRTDGNVAILDLGGNAVCTITRLDERQFEMVHNTAQFPIGTFQIGLKSRKDKMNWFVHSDHFISAGSVNIFAQIAGRATMKMTVVGDYQIVSDEPTSNPDINDG